MIYRFNHYRLTGPFIGGERKLVQEYWIIALTDGEAMQRMQPLLKTFVPRTDFAELFGPEGKQIWREGRRG
jgi:hypothetical protein